jgi:hypothetical protein
MTGTQKGGGGVGGDNHNNSLQLVELNADITFDGSTL